MGYFLASLSFLIMLSGAIVLVMLLRKQKTIPPLSSSGFDDGDDEGDMPVDWDAPLDLPPGVFTLPPEPVRV